MGVVSKGLDAARWKCLGFAWELDGYETWLCIIDRSFNRQLICYTTFRTIDSKWRNSE